MSTPANPGDEESLVRRAEALLEGGRAGSQPLPDVPALAGELFLDLLERLDEATVEKALLSAADSVRGMPDADAALEPGARLGSVRIESLLGEGGMGRVYRGFDEKLGRAVAVKTIRSRAGLSEAARARFRREARLLSRLNHPSICQVYDLLERPEGHYLLLELVEGETLRAWLEGNPPRAERLRIAIAIADAVAAAHRAGVVHRDLKPDNVMCLASGGVKVLDFGIARAQDAPLGPAAESGTADAHAPGGLSATATSETATGYQTELGSVVGTPAYMSPEQARGAPATAASDVYSLGILLHELLVGSRPRAKGAEPAAGREAAEVELPRDLGPRTARLLESMLDDDPQRRPSVTTAVESLRWAAAAPERSRHRRRVGVLGGLLVAIFCVAIALTVRWTRPRPLFVSGQVPRLAVLAFENRGGDAELEWVERGLAEMVSENLGRIAGVEVVPFPELLELLDQPGRRARPAPSEQVAAVTQAFGATVVLRGAVERGADGRFRLSYSASRPGVLERERTIVADDLFAAANELSSRIGRRVGPDALAVDLRDSFSADPVVNRVYAEGLQQLRSERAAAAEPFFRVAARLDPDLALADLRLAETLAGQSRGAEAAEAAGRVLAHAAERGDGGLKAAALTVLAAAADARDDREEALRLGREAVAAARSAGDREREAQAEHTVGRILRFLDPPAARAALERARAQFAELGHQLGLGKATHALGVLDDEAGDRAAAERRFREALAIGERLDAPRLRSIALDSLAILAVHRGDYEGQLAILVEARELAEQTGDRRSMVFILNNFGDGYHALGRMAEAEASFREGEAFCAANDLPNPCALIAFNFAELLLVTERAAEALPLLERSERYYGASDPDLVYLRALHARLSGDPEARALLERAIEGAGPARGEEYREAFVGLGSS